MDFAGRSYPSVRDFDSSGFALILAMVKEEVDRPIAAFIVADGMREEVAQRCACFLDCNPEVLFDPALLEEGLPLEEGARWVYLCADGASEWLADLFEDDIVFCFPSELPINPDGFGAVILALELEAGEPGALDAGLADYDYRALRRKVFAAGSIAADDRMELAGLGRKAEAAAARGGEMGERMMDLSADVGDALAGAVEVSPGLFSVVVDTSVRFRISEDNQLPRNVGAGFRSVIAAHGLTVRQAAWVQALVSAAPLDFLTRLVLVSEDYGGEDVIGVRIVPDCKLGWIGTDLTGCRNADRYAKLADVSREAAASSSGMTLADIASRILELEAEEAKAAVRVLGPSR